jgi:hypothetical protein
MNGSKTDARLRHAARTVANIVPNAQYGELPRQTHNVKPEILVPAVVEFMASNAAAGRS